MAAASVATDPKLVPYGAMTATFYTGVGLFTAPLFCISWSAHWFSR